MSDPRGPGPGGPGPAAPPSPLDQLGIISIAECELTPDLTLLEAWTPEGILSLYWHGPFDAEEVVVCCSGAAGGVIGPGHGLWHELGVALVEQGIGTIRFGYRNVQNPNMCLLDAAAVLELAASEGARRAVTLGHSFGGAVAVRVAAAIPSLVVGVGTYATQSGGCEVAGRFSQRPMILFHGGDDKTIPVSSSAIVAGFHGRGELVLLKGAGHGLEEAADELLDKSLAWIPKTLAAARPEPA